jgi:hypothetical protein
MLYDFQAIVLMVLGASIRLYTLVEIVDYYGVGVVRYRLYLTRCGSHL